MALYAPKILILEISSRVCSQANQVPITIYDTTYFLSQRQMEYFACQIMWIS